MTGKKMLMQIISCGMITYWNIILVSLLYCNELRLKNIVLACQCYCNNYILDMFAKTTLQKTPALSTPIDHIIVAI